MSRILLGAIASLAIASLAHAETPTPTVEVDPADIDQLTEFRLDDAFEKSTASAGDETLANFGGPTTMDCSLPSLSSSPETCVVTAARMGPHSMPAAIAPN